MICRNMRLGYIAGIILIYPITFANAESFTMTPLPSDPKVKPQIIGGRKSNPSDWPATFAFSDCTSTAIGPRVLLTAAHCLPDGAKGNLEVAGKVIKVECAHHPSYTPDDTASGNKTTSADWALCAAKTEDIPLKTFETINLNANLLKTKAEILLTGFGCNDEGGSDGGYGVQFEGEADIEPVKDEDTQKDITGPDGLPKRNNPPWARHYATTKGGAATCYGDSGGAAYLYLDPAKQSRRIMGVTSRGDIKTISYLSVTSTGAFESWSRDVWAKNWAKKIKSANFEICGVNDKTINCK